MKLAQTIAIAIGTPVMENVSLIPVWKMMVYYSALHGWSVSQPELPFTELIIA